MSAATLAPPGPPAVAAPPPTAAAPPPPRPTPAGPPAEVAAADLHRFSRTDYRRMTELGILPEGGPIELLDGLLVRKMPKKRPHVIANKRVQVALERVLPAGWSVTTQNPVALDDSDPEPDAYVLRGSDDDYLDDHPTSKDVPLIVEVAATSLGRDQGWKRAIYARNAVATYWVVNLDTRVLEVYSLPANGEYTSAVVLTAADRAEVVLDGVTVGSVAVAELLP